MRKKTFLAFLLAFSSLLLFVLDAETGNYHYTEDFTSKLYCDTLYTTALWDTVSGELKLSPFQLTFVGSYNTPGGASDIMIAGDWAFVADGDAGLTIIDIRNPASPSVFSIYPTSGSAEGLWIDGDLAYVCDDLPGLLIIDISKPGVPSLEGTYNTSGRALGVEVAGDYAYIADGAAGLTVVDVSNPSSPSLAGNYDTPGGARTIDVEGNYAYIADRGGGGLQIIDISDPTLPTFAGSYSPGGDTWGVEVSGNVAYLGATSTGLVAVDVTDPTNPTLMGTVAAGSARQLDVAGDYVYLAGYDAVYVIDVSDPSNPLLVDSYTTPGITNDVAVAGELAYVADGTDGGLQVIDISDPTGPSLAGNYYTPDQAYGIAISGNYAYVGDNNYGLVAIDISVPTSPSFAGRCDTPEYARDVAISGDYAYVAEATGGLQVVDISDPTSPSLAGNYNTGDARGIAVSGDYAYVADWSLGLQVVDISDPTSPSLAGSIDTLDYLRGITVSGDYAYVADGIDGLQVVDISDPTTPSIAGNYNTPGSVYGAAISGDYAYVADYSRGLQVIDIGDPTNPTLAGSYDTPGYATNVAISGDYAYVADYDSGLTIIDISDPTNPTLAWRYETGDDAHDVAISGDYAYVAADFFGLEVIRILQRFVIENDNMGQSVQINSSSYDIGWIKLASTQTDTVQWEVSANSGNDWQEVLPDASWYLVTVPGNDLRWRSTHKYSYPFINPACSNVVIDYLSTFAIIESVTDIPNDQGRQVSISWARSGYDYAGSPTPIAQYAIYRQIDDGLSMSKCSKRSGINGNDMPINGGQPQPRLAYPLGDWHFLMTVPADCENTYAAVVSTLADSTVTEGIYYTTFFVSALTALPGVYFDSPPDSGYSVDNLFPSVPIDFAIVYNAGSGNELTWKECSDEDFACFNIYRSEMEDFDPTSGDLVHTTAGNGWLDTVEDGWKYSYKITSVDGTGNESNPASPGSITDADVPEVPDAFALYQNTPNPFNPMTTIRFDLPVRSHVRLAVYNVKGQLVQVLLDRDIDAGSREVVWDGRHSMGRAVASGIYFYRLDTPSFSESRKMILLR